MGRQDLSDLLSVPFQSAHAVWNMKSVLRHTPASGLVSEGSVVEDAVVEDEGMKMIGLRCLVF